MRRENVTHRRTGSEQAKLGEIYVIHWLIAGWRFFFRDLQTLRRKLQLCLQKLEIPSSETKTHFSRTIFFEDKTLSPGTTPNRLQKCQTLFCGNYMITWHIGELHFSCHIKIAASVLLPFSFFFISVMFSGAQPHSTLQHWFGSLVMQGARSKIIVPKFVQASSQAGAKQCSMTIVLCRRLKRACLWQGRAKK